MKTNLTQNYLRNWLAAPCAALAALATMEVTSVNARDLAAEAGVQYQGGGLSVMPMRGGARLRCVFQKLEGQVTAEGLWLNSTVEPRISEKFQVMACAVGRAGALRPLPSLGTVIAAHQQARWVRVGLTEEYSASLDGVRQDFIIAERPAGDGDLRVELAVTGATAESLEGGARLVLDGSRRKISYQRLQVVDAAGKGLTARMEVTSATHLAVRVEDATATYPVRIDPTFSDADWSSPAGTAGVNGEVWATAVDGSGNLYIGGDFTSVGGVPANHVAKWNGSAWSALGSGLAWAQNNAAVYALAVSGNDLYVGGTFTSAGGTSAICIAKWDGNSWSSLAGGVNNTVSALAVAGTNLYVAGSFSMAGGSSANYIAKWDGTAWSALGRA